MAQSEARAWWADVEHLRDDYERTAEARRRADEAELAARRALLELDRVDAEVAVALADDDRDETLLGDRARGPRQRGTAIPTRRTVEIRGRPVQSVVVPRYAEVESRRPPRRAVERVGPHPDRLALWALLMGLVLILVAVGTADAAALGALASR